MNRQLSIFALTFILSLAGGLGAQQDEQSGQIRMQLQLAQQFEARGNYESALEIYQTLHRLQPKNYTYFDGVARCLANLNRHQELIDFVQKQIQLDPQNIQYQIRLGDAYLRLGNEGKAVEIWNKVIHDFPKNPSVYRSIANAWIANRNFDRGIETYLLGRKKIGNPAYFALELAQWYAYRLDYAAATEEYLRFLKQNPNQLSYVQSRIASFAGDFETYKQVTSVLERWISHEKETLVYRKLMVSFLISYQDYEGAYHQVQEIERLKPRLAPKDQPGRDLLELGRILMAEEQVALAERVFRELLKKYPAIPNRPFVEFSLGRALLSRSAYREAVALFRRVFVEFPRSPWAVEACLLASQVWLEDLQNPDSSSAILTRGLELFAKLDQRAKLWLMLSEINVRMGALDAAEKALTEAQNVPIRNVGMRLDVQMEALFRSAELAFFRQDFEDAQKKLQQVLQIGRGRATNNLVNDALEFSFLIEENLHTAPAALVAFSRGQLLSRQRNQRAAITEFLQLAESYASSPLAPQALFRAAELLEEEGDYLKAVEVLDRIPESYSDSPRADEAIWRAGLIWETRLKNTGKAISHFESLLLRYPGSLWSEQARKKIRELEGKS